MTDSQMLDHLANVQDTICDIIGEALTMQSCKQHLNRIYPDLAAAVDALIAREAQTVGAANQ